MTETNPFVTLRTIIAIVREADSKDITVDIRPEFYERLLHEYRRVLILAGKHEEALNLNNSAKNNFQSQYNWRDDEEIEDAS
jgi:hypothetical protein